MPLSDFDGLLPALDWAFGITAIWQVPAGAQVPIKGRFRIDPYEVPLGATGEGLNTTQTWFFIDGNKTPARSPGQHDLLYIRGQWYEIVQIEADDLGEIGCRLVKAMGRS